MIEWLRELWCDIRHWSLAECGNWPNKCRYCTRHSGHPGAPLYPPPVTFKWIRDYGPYWEPGSTAFWLEPETADELASWYAKYRPGEYGIKEAAGIRISIEPIPRPQISSYALQQHVGYMNQLAASQQLNMQQYGIQQVGLLGALFGNRRGQW